MALNCRLYGIIRDFESETDRRLEERYMQFLWARDRSFYTVSTLAVFISLLTILLYIIIHRELNHGTDTGVSWKLPTGKTRNFSNPGSV